MNVPFLLRFVLYCALVVPFAEAVAGYITITNTSQVHLDEATRKVTVNLSLRNDGDTQALQVGVSFPTLNKRTVIAESLSPKEERGYVLSLSYDELGMLSRGQYILPYLSFYKDPNYFPFSTVQKIYITLPPVSIKKVLGRIIAEQNVVKISGKSVVKYQIENVSDEIVHVVPPRLIFPEEFQAKTKDEISEFELSPRQRRDITFEIHNLRALQGTTHIGNYLLEGTIGDEKVSYAYDIFLEIIPPWWNPRNVYICSLALIFVSVLVDTLVGVITRRKRTAQSQEALIV